jgi:flagellar basal body-associated protein FliL
MMMIILFGVALAIGIYFYMKKSKTKTEEPVKNVIESFIPSNTFTGAKKGYIFKNDSNGIGYYLDKQ